MENITVGLARLPLELRNTIYEHVIGDITTLTLPKSTYNSSATQPFQRKLPPCLVLNHQILLEATNAFIHRATITMRELTIAHPPDLLLAIRPNARFPNLRHLTITSKQAHYSSSSTSVHSIVHRCPQLQHLTVPFFSTIFRGDDYKPDFAPIFTHETLLKVDMLCYDAAREDIRSCRIPVMYQWTWFDKWWCGQESRIVLRVLLDGGLGGYDEIVQDTWRREGSITYDTWAGYKA